MILYNGAAASRFSRAVLSIQYLGGKLGNRSVTIAAEPEIRNGPLSLAAQLSHPVASSITRNDHSYGTGTPFGPFNLGINVAHLESQIERGGYSPADDTNVLYVASGNRIDVLTSGGAMLGSRSLQSGAPTANIGALALLADGARATLFATDLTCTMCSVPGGSGIFALDASSGLGEFTPVVSGASGVDLGTPGSAPLGVATLAQRQGALPSGSLFIAARNSIYRFDLASDGAGAPLRSPTGWQLVAGSGVPGAAGAGSVDGPGARARFNFGAHRHVGMALDRIFERASALYVTDPENRAVRKIDLRSGFVSTFARFQGVPGDLVTDAFSGSVYVSIPSLNAIFVIEPGRAPRLFANQSEGAVSRWATLADGPRVSQLPLISQPEMDASAELVTEPDCLAFDPQGASLIVTSPVGPLQFLR